MCLACNNPIQKNIREKTLEFAIEVLREFSEGYDEMFSIEQRKRPIQFLEALVNTLINKNDLENEKIITLQSMVKHKKRGLEKITNSLQRRVITHNIISQFPSGKQLKLKYELKNIAPESCWEKFATSVENCSIQYPI